MTIFDRYLLWLFVKIYLICLVSFTGLFIVIHLFTNMDEMMAIKNAEGWSAVLFDFYAPRVAEIFDKTSAIWILMAAVFAVSLMQRKRELTAVEATGIPRSRILRAMFLCAMVIVGLAAANRELVLPKVRDQLIRNAQTWKKQDGMPMNAYHDLERGIKIRGASISLTQNLISKIDIQFRSGGSNAVSHIQAESGIYHAGSENQAPGIRLNQISYPSQRENLKSGEMNGTQIFWPGDSPWLKPDECYVVCKFDPYQAAYGSTLLNYQSTPEMMSELRKPRAWYGSRTQINVHARLLQPILEFSLLLFGLPIVIRQSEKNVFYAATICFMLIAGFGVSILASHALGDYSIIRPAALAAWMPAIIFIPLAIVAYRSLDR